MVLWKSNPGQVGRLEAIKHFDEDDRIGRLEELCVWTALVQQYMICCFNEEEVELEGSVACTTLEIFYNKDIRCFSEMVAPGVRGGPAPRKNTVAD